MDYILVNTKLPYQEENGNRISPFALAMIRQGRLSYIGYVPRILLILQMLRQPYYSKVVNITA